jgi:CheY-like chemotaxis protein/two-component sensor histidine kinase
MGTQTLQTYPQGPESGEPRTCEVDELHSIFIQTVAHELRTPVSIIHGYAEMLREGGLGQLAPEQQRAVTVIANRAIELRNMVERIGMVLAIETHAVASLPLSLSDLVARAVEEHSPMATEAGLALELHVAPDLPLMSGDPYLLEHAVECLLDNALKFTPQGGQIKVEVYTEPGWICLTVTDTGIGMAAEEMTQIFTPFYQVDGSTTRRYGGMGLGLSVAKAVVERHGGEITVFSQPGQGSRFTVRLPATSLLMDEAQLVTKDGVLRRILIVDDEENVALTLQAGLERLPQCEITVATSGLRALEHLEQEPFDLLITDYKMPGTDGLALATRVRQLYPQISIIMVTAYGDESLRREAAGISIERVLDKPIKLDEIRGAASAVLGDPHNGAQESAAEEWAPAHPESPTGVRSQEVLTL